MRTQNDWINIFKSAMRIKTDYRLAKRWQVEPTRIHQYRKGRLKLPLAAILDMAESINIDPVEIMASLAIAGARMRQETAHGCLLVSGHQNGRQPS